MPATVPADGRRARHLVSHRAIIDAARQLILDGTTEPTAADIAKRAGLTTRTLFRHFPDMDSLFAEIMRDAQTLAQATMDEPFPADAWQDQLGHMVERRARIYEHLLPLQLSGQLLRRRSPHGALTHQQGVDRRRQRLKTVLPEVLAEDSTLFEALDAVLSSEFWVSLRRDQHLSVKRAQAVMYRAVRALAALDP